MKKLEILQPATKSLIIHTIICLLLFGTSINAGINPETKKSHKSKPRETSLKVGSKWLKNQAVEFLENKGQILTSENKPASHVLFKAEAPGIDLYITENGLSYVFLSYEENALTKREKRKEKSAGIEEKEEGIVKFEKIDLDLVGANIKRENILKEDTGLAYYNYLLGSLDKPIYHVKKYRKITIKNVYPGIDWVLYNSSSSGFKYDFIVHPGAESKQIELLYRSAHKVDIDENGNLSLKSSSGKIEEKAPISYFLESGKKTESSFQIISQSKKLGLFESRVKIICPEKNSSQTLVIDPILVWSTFYGGTNFEGTYAIDTDPSGNVFLCGYGASNNFPILSMGTYFQSTYVSPSGFIVKFDNNGTLLWSTYYGPASTNYLAADNLGNVFICGYSNSTLLPTFDANTYYQGTSGGGYDAYIAKFDNLGNCTWCTFYGGNLTDQGLCVATDASSNVFLLGSTSSSNFPLQNSGGYYEPTISGSNSGFIVKFDNSGNRLWSTYVKGLTSIIGATDLSGNLYLTGMTNSLVPTVNPGGTSYYQGAINGTSDSYLLKFNNIDQLVWGTYYGGSGNNDRGTSVATDKLGNVFFTGITNSTDFPVQNAGTYFQGAMAGNFGGDAYLLKFDNTMTRKWATYFGGSRDEFHYESDNLTIDTCGNVFLGVTTKSRNLPFQTACDGGMYDNTLDTSVSNSNDAVYLARFSNTGNLLWSSYFCGDGRSFRTTLDADRFGNVFFSGEWNGVVNPSTYPLVYPASPTYTQAFMGYEDLYVAKFTNNLATQHFSYTSLCNSGANVIPILASGFLTGGTFSASPGLSINPTNGLVTTSLSSAGTYTVKYLMAPCYCPGALASGIGSATIAILSAPTLTIAGKTTMCLKETRTFTVSGGTTYTWNTGAQSNTINASPTTTATIVYTVSSLATNGCVAKKVLTVTVSKCTGFEDFEMGSAKLLIYPNPNNGQFTISSDSSIELEITNELGQLIQSFELSDKNERKIVISNLANGIYFLKDKNSIHSNNYKIIVTN